MIVPEPTVDPSWGDSPESNEHAKFKNIYEITLNSSTVGYCLYTSLNDIVFLSNFSLSNYTALDSFGVLPADCIPSTDVFMPIVVNDGTNIISTYCIITSNGELTLPNSYTSVDIYFIGMSFNNCATYFNPN